MNVRFTLSDEEVNTLTDDIHRTFLRIVKAKGRASIRKQLEKYTCEEITDNTEIQTTYTLGSTGIAIRLLLEKTRKKK